MIGSYVWSFPVLHSRDVWVRTMVPYNQGRRGSVKTVRFMNNRTLLMYGVAGEKRPIFVESDAFLYNLGDPSIIGFFLYISQTSAMTSRVK
jgi:hypothetical protein